jgi:protocatechuate 3,4-dioxygenase beta subunit
MKSLCFAAGLLAVALAGQNSTGVIDGVVIDDAGSPVPSASVALMSETGRVIRTLAADDTATFIFDALPEGRYTVGASKVGYAARSYGQSSPAAGHVVIALAPNGRFRARVRLPRVGGISGRVVDENGQPVSVAVRALRFGMQNGVRTLDERPLATEEADRQGRYRFADLTPGDYLISALGPDGELRRMTPEAIQRALQAVQQPGQPLPSRDAGGESTVSYVTVYYPGVVSRVRATALQLAPGEERTNVNLQLQVLPTIRLEGTVLNQDGKPLAYATARLIGADDGVTWSYGQTTTAGYFHLAPVPLGPYSLSVAGTKLDLTLTDPRAASITVRLEPATSIAGRVVFDGATPPPDCRKVACRPILVSRASQPNSALPGIVSGVLDPAGPVAFAGVPPGLYSVALGAPIAGWTMESAVIGGREAMDVPIEVAPRQDLSGLVVTFTDRLTELAGTTPVGGMAPPADAVSIVVFPADRRLWIPGARRVRVARPDTSGQYRVIGLPPGDYLVAVVTNFDAETELDASRLATLETTAARVAVRRPDPR